VSDVGPLEEGLSLVDDDPESVDDDPKSLGSSDDSSDEPESVEPPGDGSGSLGDIGASQASSVGGMSAFAVPFHSRQVPRQDRSQPRCEQLVSSFPRCSRRVTDGAGELVQAVLLEPRFGPLIGLPSTRP
jgi:hypothetical protein